MRKQKGNIILECFIALVVIELIVLLVSSTVTLKHNTTYLEYDYQPVSDLWKDLRRCSIYCHQNDPIVDIP